MITRLLLGLMLLLCTAPLHARLIIEVCNTGNTDLYVATLHYEDTWLHDSDFQSDGWYIIHPQSSCGGPFFGYDAKSVYDDEDTDSYHSVYIAFGYLDNTGRFGPLDDGDSKSFCAAPHNQNFHFTGYDRDEMASCHGRNFLFPFTRLYRKDAGTVVIEMQPNANERFR
jgi:hypothetical protein